MSSTDQKRPRDDKETPVDENDRAENAKETEELSAVLTAAIKDMSPMADAWHHLESGASRAASYRLGCSGSDDATLIRVTVKGSSGTDVAMENDMSGAVMDESITSKIVALAGGDVFVGDSLVARLPSGSDSGEVALVRKEYRAIELGGDTASHHREFGSLVKFLTQAMHQVAGLPTTTFLLNNRQQWVRLLLTAPHGLAQIPRSEDSNAPPANPDVQAFDSFLTFACTALRIILTTVVETSNMQHTAVTLVSEVCASPFLVHSAVGRLLCGASSTPEGSAAADGLLRACLKSIQCLGHGIRSPYELPESVVFSMGDGLNGVAASLRRLYHAGNQANASGAGRKFEAYWPFVEQFHHFITAFDSSARQEISTMTPSFPFTLPSTTDGNTLLSGLDDNVVTRSVSATVGAPNSSIASMTQQLDALMALSRLRTLQPLAASLTKLQETSTFNAPADGSVVSLRVTGGECVGFDSMASWVGACNPDVLADFGAPFALRGVADEDSPDFSTSKGPFLASLGFVVGEQFINLWMLLSSRTAQGDLICHALENADTVGQLFQASAAFSADGQTPNAFLLVDTAGVAEEARKYHALWLLSKTNAYRDRVAIQKRVSKTSFRVAVDESLYAVVESRTRRLFFGEGIFDPYASDLVGTSVLPSNNERNLFRNASESVQRTLSLDAFQVETVTSAHVGSGLRVVVGATGSGKTRVAGASAMTQGITNLSRAKDETAVPKAVLADLRKAMAGQIEGLNGITSPANADETVALLKKANECVVSSRSQCDEMIRYQSIQRKCAPVVLATSSETAGDALLSLVRGAGADQVLRGSDLNSNVHTKSLRAPLVSQLSSSASSQLNSLSHVAANAALDRISLPSLRSLTDARHAQDFAAMSADELFKATEVLFPGSVTRSAVESSADASARGFSTTFTLGSVPQGGDSSNATQARATLSSLGRKAISALDGDDLDALSGALITVQQDEVSRVLQQARCRLRLTFVALCDLINTVAVASAQAAGVLLYTGGNLSVHLRLRSCISASALVLDSYERFTPTELFCIPTPNTQYPFSVLLTTASESFLEVAQQQSLAEMAESFSVPTWGQHLIDAIHRSNTSTRCIVRLGETKRIINSEVSRALKVLAPPDCQTAGVADDGAQQHDIPVFPCNTSLWTHSTGGGLRGTLQMETAMLREVWRALSTTKCSVGVFVPAAVAGAIRKFDQQFCDEEKVETQKRDEDGFIIEDNQGQSTDEEPTRKLVGPLPIYDADVEYHSTFDVVLLATCGTGVSHKLPSWLLTSEWLWRSVSRASRGLVVVGRTALIDKVSSLRALRQEIFAIEAHNNACWVPRTIPESTIEQSFAVFPIHCAHHKKSRSLLTIAEDAPVGSNTATGSVTLAGGRLMHLFCHPCRMPCLQKYDRCSMPNAHVCLLQCHLDSDNGRDTHTVCPYPSPHIYPCGHRCTKTCGEDPGDCEVVSWVQLECGQEVICGFDGESPMYHTFHHYQRLQCGAEPEECQELVEKRCPNCGAKGKLPCSQPIPERCNNCRKIQQETLQKLPPTATATEKEEALKKALAIALMKADLLQKKVALDCARMGPESNPQYAEAMKAEEKIIAEREAEDKEREEAVKAVKNEWTAKMKTVLGGQMKTNQTLELEFQQMVAVARTCIESQVTQAKESALVV